MTTSDFVKGSRVALQLCDEAIAKGDENRAMKQRIAELESEVKDLRAALIRIGSNAIAVGEDRREK